jgi:hypothetical protein
MSACLPSTLLRPGRTRRYNERRRRAERPAATTQPESGCAYSGGCAFDLAQAREDPPIQRTAPAGLTTRRYEARLDPIRNARVGEAERAARAELLEPTARVRKMRGPRGRAERSKRRSVLLRPQLSARSMDRTNNCTSVEPCWSACRRRDDGDGCDWSLAAPCRLAATCASGNQARECRRAYAAGPRTCPRRRAQTGPAEWPRQPRQPRASASFDRA